VPGGVVRWLVVSDIHFDPFADPALVERLIAAPASAWPALFAAQAKRRPSGYTHDTNAALLASTLAEMRRVNSDPSVILVPGDFLSHEFGRRFDGIARHRDGATYRAFVLKTMDYVTGELRRTFPRAQILPAIGNNDGFCGDYASTPNDAFLAHVARTWAPLVNVAGRAPNFIRTFSQGGYYEARLPPREMRVVVPNSVFWSIFYRNHCDVTDSRPEDVELDWLAKTLGRHAAGERTWLMTHIPPGVDTFRTSLRFGDPSLLYEPGAQTRFLGAVNDGRADVRAMVAGHLHDTWFRQSAAGSGGDVPILIAPSVSPIFGNDPSFLELQVSPQTAQIADVRAYSLGGLLGAYGRASAWHEAYDANAAYGMRGITPTTLADLHRREESTPSLRRALERNAASNGIARLVTELDWRSSWCAETGLTRDAFVACRSR
jgi:sphingomyelin phosphodiesterase acid-like 3